MLQANIKTPKSNKPRFLRKNNKMYDLQTPNKSFIRLARDLKMLGIKNWYFMLEIRDTSIANINPHQTDKNGECTLSKDQVARIINESKQNFWYFAREVVRIKGTGGPPCQYKANRGNIAQSWCLLHGLDSYLVLPRQTGKTITATVLITWALVLGTTNARFIFIGKDAGVTKNNLQRVKDTVDLLPVYMRHEYILADDGKIQKAIRNATTMTDPVTRNTIKCVGGPTSEESALNVARGEAASILYFDEPEFTKYLPKVIANTYPAFKSTAENAKKNNSIYGRIFTCTPGDLGTKTGEDALTFVNHTVEWTEKLYDWDPEKIHLYIHAQGGDGEETNGVLYIQYHYWQVGLTRQWADEVLKGMDNRVLDFRREYLLQRMSGSDDFPYNKEDLAVIESYKGKILEELFLLDYYRFKIYRHLNKATPYLVGIDCSTGTNQDSNAITIINPKDLRVDAEFACSYIGETEFENLLKELCKVIPKCVLIIERNSVGDSIVDHLLNSPYRERLYFDKAIDLVAENVKKHESIESILKHKASLKQFYGVHTNTKTRPDMFRILAKRITENKEDFVGENLISQIASLVKKGTKIEAGPGAHDDSVMSYLIAMYVYYHGNNLYAFGITQIADDDELDNSGIYIPGVSVGSNLDDDTKEMINEMYEKERYTQEILDWDSKLEEQLKISQNETSKLINKGFLQPKTEDIENPELHLNYFEDSREGSIDMGFFDEINGII